MRPKLITCPHRVNGPAHRAGLCRGSAYTCLEDVIFVVEIPGLKHKGQDGWLSFKITWKQLILSCHGKGFSDNEKLLH